MEARPEQANLFGFMTAQPTTAKPVNYPTSKQPNPSKFHHNNRFLLPFMNKRIAGNGGQKANVTIRKPGQIIKSNDGKFTYQVQDNGSVVKVQNKPETCPPYA